MAMIITKVSSLKKFGIFRDFSWNKELPEFKKFNLIYGWNRSGKTTLSRVFASCEKKCVYNEDDFKEYPKGGEFELETNGGITVKDTDVDTNSLPIRVFNRDFIDKNISFDPNHCDPIVYVSGQDIASKRLLDQLKTSKIKLDESYKQAKKDKSSKDSAKNNFLTGLGREVANIVFAKSYNRLKAERTITQVGIDNFSDKVLSDEDRARCEETSRGSKRESQNQLSNFSLSLTFDEQNLSTFKKLFDEVEKLLQKEVIAQTLDRLKDDPDLNSWVERGFDLHRKKIEKDKCLFCQNQLEYDFLDTLSKHFSQDYEELQASVTQLKREVVKLKRQPIMDQNHDLYPVLKDEYTEKATELNGCIKKMNAWIDEVVKKLDTKHRNPLEPTESPSVPDEFGISYNRITKKLNEIINDHNDTVKRHTKEVTKAREKLELHTIAKALSDGTYKKMVTDLQVASEKEDEALKATKENDSKIADLEERTSNIIDAINSINQHLKEFFGREEIKLELAEDKQGYKIIREGQPANNLSEGEKTAIAFSYFVAKVREGSFALSKGIIFIDDPISSLDSNFIYHCFAMINAYFKDAGQLFISTHNFQLFNLVKRWFTGKNHRAKEDNQKRGAEQKSMHCEFFMVENDIEANERKAKIVKLDNTLRNYESEYQFLFVKLKKFSEKQDTDYEDFYTIGNMARRFFDIFADFKIPNTGDPKSKILTLVGKTNEVSAIDARKVYGLLNASSHNYDPISMIEHKDTRECKDAIRVLLRVVEVSDPEHFKILDKQYTRTGNP